jgi:hypothetical protein
MASFISNNLNFLYNKITNLFTTEEDSLKILITKFFTDYDDIIQDNKIIFTIHIQKITPIQTLEPCNCHSNLFVNNTNNAINKKNYNYKYKYTFSPENYKQEKKLFYVNLYIPYNLNYDYMILKKYYYNIYLVDNNKRILLKENKQKIRDYTEIITIY